jgi:hypothetical protein
MLGCFGGILVSAPRRLSMDAPKDDTAVRRLRRWWLSPPRAGLHRLINPWEYRHLRVFGAMRIGGGGVAAAAGAVCLWYGVYGWAAFFLVVAALDLAGGYWYLTIARSAPTPG